MTKTIKFILAIHFIFLWIITSNAKPRFVILENELKEALLTAYVEIVEYTDTTIGYTYMTIDSIKTTKIHGSIIQDPLLEKHTTGYWPIIGEKVLIVVGKSGYISLFATMIDEYYRFWSPSNTGSTALFLFKDPAMKLPNASVMEALSEEYQSCWDGCLIPIIELEKYKN